MRTDETGFHRRPLPPLTVVVDTVVTTRHDPWPHSRSSLTVFAEDVDGILSKKSLESSSTQSGDELKLEGII